MLSALYEITHMKDLTAISVILYKLCTHSMHVPNIYATIQLFILCEDVHHSDLITCIYYYLVRLYYDRPIPQILCGLSYHYCCNMLYTPESSSHHLW